MDEFTLRFRHPATLLLAGVACWAVGEFAVTQDNARYVLFAIAGLCLAIALWFIRELLDGLRSDRVLREQAEERYNLEAVTRFAAAIGDLPPDGKIQVMAKMFPGYGFESVYLRPNMVVQENTGSEARQYSWPSHLGTNIEWERLAKDYFEFSHALSIDYYTENGLQNNKIFRRRQFERILEAIVENGIGDKDVLSGVVTLTSMGEQLLRGYYKPVTPSLPNLQTVGGA